MAIKEGDKIPNVKVKAADMSDITTDALFTGKKVVLFAVPGAFTPTCSNKHLPGFIEKADEIRAKGVDDLRTRMVRLRRISHDRFDRAARVARNRNRLWWGDHRLLRMDRAPRMVALGLRSSPPAESRDRRHEMTED